MSLATSVDCNCGFSMVEGKIEDLEARSRIYFKCQRCGNEVVVYRWK